MLNSRKELFDIAKNTYKNLLQRTANRYYGNYQYIATDNVGFECTLIEDVLRPLWGIAPFLKEKDLTVVFNGKTITAVEFINNVMLDGTKENSPKLFDRNVTKETEYVFSNQTTTEMAAYLVAVRFAKEELWDVLSKENQDTIALWLKKWAITAIKDSWQNNHYWYPIYCIEILNWLGYDCSECQKYLEKGYEFLESLYYGNGWYSDGELGRFDYYEAWAHHTYTLLWLLIVDNTAYKYDFKKVEYKKRTEEFLKYFIRYYDSNGGMVAYGRSIGYRFASIAPFGLAGLVGLDVDLGLCKNVILKNVSYFYENSIPTNDGCFPLGYLYETTGFCDRYASDGSISCYTQGFLVLLAGEDHPLWTSEIKSLPIETENYFNPCLLKGLQIAISGNNQKNGVTLYNNGLHYFQDKYFNHRFNDMAGSYSKFVYNSRSGYALSTVDLPSVDNMISLFTPDGVMASHRRRILDAKFDGEIYSSYHIPFINDKNTTIKTWLIPLEKGYHARIHKVKLSQEYIVVEGGYSIGVTTDGYKEYGNKVVYSDYISEISVFTDVKTSCNIERSQPGMHILAPQNLYPVYRTDVLPVGEYIFTSLVYFATDGVVEEKPTVKIKENVIKITQNGKIRTVEI